jgi:hypothetical protein
MNSNTLVRTLRLREASRENFTGQRLRDLVLGICWKPDSVRETFVSTPYVRIPKLNTEGLFNLL